MDVWIKSFFFFFFFFLFFLRPKSWGGLRLCLSLCSFPLGCNLPDALSPDLKWPQGMAYRWAPKLVCQEQAPGVAGPTLQGHLGSPWGGPSFQARGFCRGGPPHKAALRIWRCQEAPLESGSQDHWAVSSEDAEGHRECAESSRNIWKHAGHTDTHIHTHTHGHFH